METTSLSTGKVYNHRDFWVHGYGAKGLDRDALSIHDVIEFDNGDRIPAFARSRGRNLPMHGPLRPLTDAQESWLVGRDAEVRTVRADGTAVVWDRTNVAIGYAARYREITADGRVIFDS